MSLEDAFRDIREDPEFQRAMEEGEMLRERSLEEFRDISSRPRSGPDAPTDGELLWLISDLFYYVHRETPFSDDYDALIERLSFTSNKP